MSRRAPAAAAFALVLGLSLESGGFLPGAWTWSSALLVWAAGVALLTRPRVNLGPLERSGLVLFCALTAWTALSIAWSGEPGQSFLEVRRDVVYVAAALATALWLPPAAGRRLVAALAGAVVLAVGYGLVRYLLTASGRRHDLFEGPALFRPLGYANALGILATMGGLLALWVAASSRGRAERAAAGAGTIVLALALYLSASRGAVLAAACGLGFLLVLEPRPRRVLRLALPLAPVAAIVVAVAARLPLDDPALTPHQAGERGRYVALALLAGVAVAALVASRLVPRREVRRLRVPSLVVAACLATGVAAVVASVLISHNVRTAYWHVAWAEYRDHALPGSGAGTFGRYWVASGRTERIGGALDAHNLYLETLAELGPVGLALLASVLALPLVAGIRARRRSWVAATTAAYAAFLVHAAIDWDWEMPAVTLTALLCGWASLAGARPRGAAQAVGPRGRALLLALVAALLVVALSGLFSHAQPSG
jgi:O-antigen ligase